MSDRIGCYSVQVRTIWPNHLSRADLIDADYRRETAMKKLFKLFWIFQLIASLRGDRRRGDHGGYDHMRSRRYRPLYARHRPGGLKAQLLRRLLHGRRY